MEHTPSQVVQTSPPSLGRKDAIIVLLFMEFIVLPKAQKQMVKIQQGTDRVRHRVLAMHGGIENLVKKVTFEVGVGEERGEICQ